MKILQLRFKNLNSLAGEWKIDFTAPEYTNDGIFTISGPTGAGKSTILDAICLALYGRTPRLKNISASSNDIMTRRTGECYAEVIFETNNNKYRCHWLHRRAHGKPDGELQSPRHELAENDSDKILTSKLRDTLIEIENITGMDFNRFTQSMMLAQGQFASFLQASGNERAPILEQITGTELYSNISKWVFEKEKHERGILTNLKDRSDDIDLLTDEQEKELGTKKVLLDKQIKILKTEIQQTGEALTWKNTINLLKQQIANLEIQKVELDERIKSFLPDRNKLKKAVRAKELEADFVILGNLRTKKIDLNNRLQKILIEIPDHKEKYEENREKYIVDNKKLLGLQKVTIVELEKINKVRKIDQSIAILNDERLKLVEKIKQQESHVSIEKETLRSNEIKKKGILDNTNKIYEQIEKNSHNSELENEFAGIKEQISFILEMISEVGKSKKIESDWKEKLTKLQDSKKQLSTKLDNLVNDKSNISKNAVEIEQSMQEILIGKTFQSLQKEKDQLLIEIGELDKIQSLSDERMKLVDDKPCPLCGSTHHPYAEGNIPISQAKKDQFVEISKRILDHEQLLKKLEKVKLDEKEIDDKVVSTKNDHRLLSLEEENINSNINTNNQKIKDEISKLEKRKEEFKEKVSRFIKCSDELNSEYLIEIEKQLRFQLKEWKDLVEKKQMNEVELNSIQNVINSTTVKLESIVEQLDSNKKDLISRDNKLESEKNIRFVLFEERIPNAEEARIRNDLKVSEENANKLIQKGKDLARIIEELNHDKIALDKEYKSNEQSLSLAENRFNDLLNSNEYRDEEEFKEARLPLETRTILERNAKLLDKEENELSASLKDKTQTLKVETAKNLSDESIETLNTKLKLSSEERDKLQEENGSLHQQLITNSKEKEKKSELLREVDNQYKETERWFKLNNIIGSANGQKFRNFAQGLTFQIMVHYANKQLNVLSDRYLLIRDEKSPLDLNVMDSYQGNQIRTTKNLSGGESFIVSLALALGLSQMSSNKISVDSLFLDEGFGTLDEDTLESALGTLAMLRQDGKMIGMISHVGALKERIPTRIDVIPTRDGKSCIVGPGVNV